MAARGCQRHRITITRMTERDDLVAIHWRRRRGWWLHPCTCPTNERN